MPRHRDLTEQRAESCGNSSHLGRITFPRPFKRTLRRPKGTVCRMKPIAAAASALVLLAACASNQPATGPQAASAESSTASGPSIVVTEAMGSPHVGEEAPDFELPDQDGKPVKLSAARGSVVVLAFVASFCPFSRAEQPHLAQLSRDYAGKNVRVIAI